jgi:thiosulfate reductase cytochrome b subunit
MLRGNVMHLTGLLCGLVFLYFYREGIRLRLKQFAKKKKFEAEQSDRYAFLLSLFFPFLLLVGLLLSR